RASRSWRAGSTGCRIRASPRLSRSGGQGTGVIKSHDSANTVVKRVRRREAAEAHGGSWKVAFADFCLALLCLFLVMWLMAVRQAQELQELLKAAGGNLVDEGRGRM